MDNGDAKQKNSAEKKEQIRIERGIRGLYIYFNISKENIRSSFRVGCWDVKKLD